MMIGGGQYLWCVCCNNEKGDVVEAHATATDFLWGIWAIHVAKRKLIVERFDREGLHQLQNCFVADEDLRGRNVLLLTSFSRYVNCSDTPEKWKGFCKWWWQIVLAWLAFCSPFPSGIPKVEPRTGVRASFFSVRQIGSLPHKGCTGDDKKTQEGTTWCCFCQGMICKTYINQWMGLCITALYFTCHLWIWTKYTVVCLSSNDRDVFCLFVSNLLCCFWTKDWSIICEVLNVFHFEKYNGSEKWTTEFKFLFQYCSGTIQFHLCMR